MGVQSRERGRVADGYQTEDAVALVKTRLRTQV